MNRQKKTVFRVIGIMLLVILAIITGVGAWFSHHFKGIIQSKLPALAARATDSLYLITAEDIGINFITQSVTLTNLRLRRDTAVWERRRGIRCLPAVMLDLTVPELKLSGLKWDKMSREKEMGCEHMRLCNPRITVYLTGDNACAPRQPGTSPSLNRVFARHISLTDPEITIQGRDSAGKYMVSCHGGRIEAKDWELHPGKPGLPKGFLHTKETDIELYGVTYERPGAIYSWKLEALKFNSGSHDLTLNGLSIQPAMGNEEFYSRIGHQKAIFRSLLKTVRLRGLIWEEALAAHALKASGMDIDDGDLAVYYSKVPPPNTALRRRHYPQQILQRLHLPVDIPVVNLYNCSVSYTELDRKTRRPGTVGFSHIIGSISNVTNIPARIREQPHCFVAASGKLFERSDVAVTIDFMLPDTNGSFTSRGRLLHLSASQVTEPAKALGMAEVKSLDLHQMDYRLWGNEDSVWGSFTILYNHLKIKLQKLDTITLNMRTKPLVTFVANKLVLYSDNPMPGDSIRSVATSIARDSSQSFFNMIWRNMFEAGLETAVRNEGMVDLLNRKHANMGKPKKHFFRGLFPKRIKR